MITERQLSILNAIVEDYVDFGQPIGSKTLIHRHNLDVSPATIRNEMKYLEEMNFIEKTHTSSGRTPSELGFRYYVNRLLEQTSHQNQNKIQRLNQLLIENHYDISTAMTYFADELSTKSQYATLVVRPNHKQDIINNIHLIRANNHLIVLVMVFSSGHVENIHFVSSISVYNLNLNRIANFLTNHFNGNNEELKQSLDSFIENDEKFLVKEIVEMINLHITNSK